jgi:hypothetical protein
VPQVSVTPPRSTLEHMADFPLPGDLPRLYTIRTLLLTLLTTVNAAIEEAESPRPQRTEPSTRWCVMWRWGPAGRPRVGVLHTTDCFLATGEPIGAQQVHVERRRPGRRVEACEVCKPRLP